GGTSFKINEKNLEDKTALDILEGQQTRVDISYLARNTLSAPSIMGERIESLNRVARDGDIEAFYSLIREDVKILEDIDALPFVDTPLHITASAEPYGPLRIKFAMEMMRLKPSFARKPNPNGYCPIHLALQKGHTQMEGRTPLHDVAAAATEQQLGLLDKFLLDCPNSIEDVTIQNQTALHIALENKNLEAFNRLVIWLRKNNAENAREILNRQDEEGNTVLHAVSHLLALGRRFVHINETNLEGKTALDILEGQRRKGVDNSEMKIKLVRAGALTASSLPPDTSSCAHCLRLPEI
ncbi:hypothetical protein SO802_019385, partial [Lithocarpus litseifolius]